jgi:hypothetical protein
MPSPRLNMEVCFADRRPVLDVRYDMERRVKRFLPRDPDPSRLVFRCDTPADATRDPNTIELRLEAVSEDHNVYALRFDFSGPKDPRHTQTIIDNVARTFDRWMEGLTVAPRTEGSRERYAQVFADTIAAESLPPVVKEEDTAGVLRIKQAILQGLRQGKSFSTAHHEGGTIVKIVGSFFVFQDYGESEKFEQFTGEEDFFERLRELYHWWSRRDWVPHTPPEIEEWRFIERQLS